MLKKFGLNEAKKAQERENEAKRSQEKEKESENKLYELLVKMNDTPKRGDLRILPAVAPASPQISSPHSGAAPLPYTSSAPLPLASNSVSTTSTQSCPTVSIDSLGSGIESVPITESSTLSNSNQTDGEGERINKGIPPIKVNENETSVDDSDGSDDSADEAEDEQVTTRLGEISSDSALEKQVRKMLTQLKTTQKLAIATELLFEFFYNANTTREKAKVNRILRGLHKAAAKRSVISSDFHLDALEELQYSTDPTPPSLTPIVVDRNEIQTILETPRCTRKPSLVDLLEFVRSTTPPSLDRFFLSAGLPLQKAPQEKLNESVEIIDRRMSTTEPENNFIDLFEFLQTSQPEEAPVSNKLSDAKILNSEVELMEFLRTSGPDVDESVGVLKALQAKDDYPRLLDLIVFEGKDIPAKPKEALFCLAVVQEESFMTLPTEPTNLVWNQDMTFKVTDLKSALQILVYNLREGMSVKGVKMKETFLGEIYLPLAGLNNGKIHEGWYPLVKESKKTREKHKEKASSRSSNLGSIRLKLQLAPTCELLYHVGIPSNILPIRLKSGDIILFDSSNFLSYGTKIFTRSRWDHVGMVICLCNTLMILEATSFEGVQLYNLDDKLKDYRQIATIGIRRLQNVTDKATLRKLLDFIYEVKGRPYEKSLVELFKAVYLDPHTAHNTSNQNEDFSALFCSELIAAAYQRMGLLSPRIQSNAFAPKDFASNRFSLLGSASLGPLIVFKRKGQTTQDKRLSLSSTSFSAVKKKNALFRQTLSPHSLSPTSPTSRAEDT